MGTDIVRHENGNGRLEFTPEQSQMIRDTFANGASEAEFAVLMEVAKARRLNPLLRQIHFVKRRDNTKNRDVWSTQASIDGLRAVAQRTGLYDGQDEPEFEYDDNGKLRLAKVKVYRKDWQRPAVGVAHYEEYVQTKNDGKPNSFWATKTHIMLSKCAEALALRKAFPEDLAGLYAPEEMGEQGAQLPPAPELPRISPHGEVIDAESYLSVDDADEKVRLYEECETLEEFNALSMTVDELERFHPDDRRRLGAASQRKKRQLCKPGRELNKPAAMAEDLD